MRGVRKVSLDEDRIVSNCVCLPILLYTKGVLLEDS